MITTLVAVIVVEMGVGAAYSTKVHLGTTIASDKMYSQRFLRSSIEYLSS